MGNSSRLHLSSPAPFFECARSVGPELSSRHLLASIMCPRQFLKREARDVDAELRGREIDSGDAT